MKLHQRNNEGPISALMAFALPHNAVYATLLTTMVASSFALGPIFGGLILQRASWRWVFLL
ncbi:hypothetical protein F4809DRAFT_587808, partial [Biscogniauxia mediterranea]